MRIFKTKHFTKWAKRNCVKDELLKLAAQEISVNLFEANLGGYVIKKRIATKGRGKRKSIRTIVAFKKMGHCFAFLCMVLRKMSKIILLEMKKKYLNL